MKNQFEELDEETLEYLKQIIPSIPILKKNFKATTLNKFTKRLNESQSFRLTVKGLIKTNL